MRQGIAMALIVAVGIVGGSALSEIGEANAGPQQERQMLSLAKQQLRELRAIKRSIGTSPLTGLWGEVAATKKSSDTINSTLGGPFTSVRSDIQKNEGLLEEICRAVRPNVSGYPCL